MGLACLIWFPSLTREPIFEWCVVKCGSKNRQQKDKCLKQIGLRAHNLVTILSSVVNIVGGNLYDHVTSTRESSLW